jgi:hypothetical protein
MIRCITFLFFCLLAVGAKAAAVPTEAEARDFIKRLYAEKAWLFEFARFPGDNKAALQCALIRRYVAEKLIRVDEHGFCDATPGGAESVRYSLRFYDEFQERVESSTLPRPVIRSVRRGEQFAAVDVGFRYGKSKAIDSTFGQVVFFIQMTEQGLRIVNTMQSPKWPTTDEDFSERGSCEGEQLMFSTALRSEEELTWVPSPCVSYYREELKKVR